MLLGIVFAGVGLAIVTLAVRRSVARRKRNVDMGAVSAEWVSRQRGQDDPFPF